MKNKCIRMIIVFIMILTILLPPNQSVCALWYTGPHAYSLDEYNKLVDTNAVPRNIIGYDSLRIFGEFTGFHYFPGRYWYSITDENGCEFFLYITHLETASSITYNPLSPVPSVAGGEETTDNTLAIPDSITNMAVLGNGERGTIHLNSLRYQYINGELLSIKWVSSNIEFSLSGDFADYPVNKEDTLVSRLLDPSTAQRAAAKLKRIPLRNWVNRNLWVILVAVSVPIAIGAGVFTFLRYRKKKTA